MWLVGCWLLVKGDLMERRCSIDYKDFPCFVEDIIYTFAM